MVGWWGGGGEYHHQGGGSTVVGKNLTMEFVCFVSYYYTYV